MARNAWRRRHDDRHTYNRAYFSREHSLHFRLGVSIPCDGFESRWVSREKYSSIHRVRATAVLNHLRRLIRDLAPMASESEASVILVAALQDSHAHWNWQT